MLKRWILGSMAAFAALLLSIPAGANGVGLDPPQFSVNGKPVELNNCAPVAGSTAKTCTGPVQGEFFQIEKYDLTFDQDPFVALTLGVVNTAATVQTFIFLAAVPVAPLGPGLILNGFIEGGVEDLTPENGTDASLVVPDPGAPLYAAIIDGPPVRSLLDPPQAFSTGTTPNFGPTAFGPEGFGGSATTFIALQIQFTLSPGDRATFHSAFDVVPEPGTLMLLASGIAGIAVRGRRRSA